MSSLRRVAALAVGLGLALSGPAAGELAIGGRVTRDGAGLEGARVILVPLPGRYEVGRSLLGGQEAVAPAAETRTDGDGSFRLEAPGPGFWKVRVEADGHLPAETSLKPLLDATELPALELEAAETLVVRIPGGKELDGATAGVAAQRTSQRRPRTFPPGFWATPIRRGETDVAGVARLPVAAGERLVLSADVPGSPRVRREVRGAGTVTLAPETGALRAVRAVAGGQGLAGVLIFGGDDAIPLAMTAEDGRATLPVAAGETLTLTLLAPDGRRGSHRLEPGPGRPAGREESIALVAPRVLTGQVVVYGTRRPIPGAWVWWPDGEAARTDARGDYQIPAAAVPGDTVPGDTVPADTLAAVATGYALSPAAAAQPPSGELALPAIALHPAAAVSGRVVDTEGRPIAAADVRIAIGSDSRLPSSALRSVVWLTRGGAPVTRSSRNGHFRISGLPAAADYQLMLAKTGWTPARLRVADLEPFEQRDGLRAILGRGRTGVGLVVDPDDVPVAGAEVWLAEPPRPGQARFSGPSGRSGETPATSDPGGRFEIPALLPGRYDLQVEAAGFAPVRVPGIEIPGEGEGEADLGTVVLVPGVEISGRVVDRRDRPVAEVEIDVGGSGYAAGLERAEGPRTTTDAAGRFTVDDLQRGGRVDLVARKPGYVPESLAVTLPAGEPLTLVLTRAAGVSGQVVDEAGEPVAGASVRVHSDAGRGAMNSGSTDLSGRFEIAGVPPGRSSLSAAAPGYLEYRESGLQVVEGEDLDGLELVLERGAAVEGRVLGSDGEPVAGAQVVAQPAGVRGASSAADASDDDGRYRLDGVPLGLHTVVAEHWQRGGLDSRELDVQPGTNTLDFELGGGVEVRGLVTDETGNPLSAARLTLESSPPRWRFAPQTASGADGSFLFEGVGEGTYVLLGAKEGYARGRGEEPVTVASSPISGLRVELGAGATVAGRILGLELEELAGLKVGARSRHNGRQSGQVDYAGRYSVPHLGAGEWIVYAESRSSGRGARKQITIEAGASEVSLDLELGTGHTLSGVVLRGEAPVPGKVVQVRGSSISGARTTTDHRGAFRLQDLEAGTYSLEISDFRSGTLHAENVEISGDREITITLAAGRISGQLRDDLDHSPVRGGRITLEPARRDAETRPLRVGGNSDSHGRFVLDPVPEGSWRLLARKRGYARAEATVEVAAAGAVEGLVIEMQATEGVSFEVVLSSGRIPAMVSTAVLDAAGRSVARGSAHPSTDRGTVRLTEVPAGDWELSITAEDSATSHLPITAPGRLGRIVLQPGGILEVSVPDLAGDGTGATATLLGPDGRPYRILGWGSRIVSQHRVTGGRLTARHLMPGAWQVTVIAADGRSWSATPIVAAGATTELSLP